jgi:hypothetical protein
MENQVEKVGNNLPAFNAGTLMIPSTEAIGKLENAEVGLDISVKYRKMEDWNELKDQPIRAYYLGTKQIPNDDGEMVTCAAFMDKSGVWLAGQMVLVDAVSKVDINTPLQITYRGKKANKSSKGSTNLFDVKILRINIKEGGE